MTPTHPSPRTGAARPLVGILATAAFLGALELPALAQQASPPTYNATFAYDTGWVANDSDRARVVISFPIHFSLANWMRVYFEDIELGGDLLAGTGAILRVTSHLDGHVQELDARHCGQWQNSTCYFNGDTVQVEVLAQPHTSASRLVVRSFDAGLPMGADPSQCGPTDDRVLSSDVRAARLLPIGCTGWLIDDCAGCFLTAGHCTGSISVVQFQVPLSNSNGSLNHPPPSDQYAFDPASLQTNGGQGIGNDWGYFGCFANPNTGLRPAQAQGATFVLANPPGTPNGNTIRITGYGVDSSPATSNQVQQTHAGPMVTSQGTTVQYQTDTTGGNSGSPVIWEDTGDAIGIHTHGGCSTSGSGQNSGTGINHSGVQNALVSPQGICAAGFGLPNGVPDIFSDTTTTQVTVEVIQTPTAGSVKAHYRYQGGSFSTIVLTDQGGGIFTGDLPPAQCGDDPEFYFSAQSPTCGLLTHPENAPAEFFSAVLVGTIATLFADDFETDTGWTTEIAGATAGFWERGVPVNDPNYAWDPHSDADGSGQCWLTGNTLGESDVDDGRVRLISPPIDMSQGSVLIQYEYYANLSIEGGTDKLRIGIQNMVDGVWYNLAQHDMSGGTSWRTGLVPPADIIASGVTLGDQMRVRFVAMDLANQFGSMAEFGLDAFAVATLSCGGVGTTYCTSTPNSTGAPSTISATGSASISADDLVLTADNLPSQVGIFIAGPTSAQTPFFNGVLCIDPGGLQRFVNVASPTGGVITEAVDLGTSVLGGLNAVPGSHYYYQRWNRDPAGGGGNANFSDGLDVLYVP